MTINDKCYQVKDRVLPLSTLPNPCPIRIIISEEYVYLYVGDRDWQWTKNGKFVGEGTRLARDAR